MINQLHFIVLILQLAIAAWLAHYMHSGIRIRIRVLLSVLPIAPFYTIATKLTSDYSSSFAEIIDSLALTAVCAVLLSLMHRNYPHPRHLAAQKTNESKAAASTTSAGRYKLPKASND